METVLRLLRNAASGVAALLFMLATLPGSTLAQQWSTNAPPIHTTVDANGVDLITGAFSITTQDLSVGASASPLNYIRTYLGSGSGTGGGWTDNLIGTILVSGTTYTVVFGGGAENFTLTGGAYVPAQGQGSTLVYNSGNKTYTYTSAVGAVVTFDGSLTSPYPIPNYSGLSRPRAVKYANGYQLTYTYQTVSVCVTSCPGTMVTGIRLSSVNDNHGYQLKLAYPNFTPMTTGDLAEWTQITSVTGNNNAQSYCDPTTTTCSIPATYPKATYAWPAGSTTQSTTTDRLGRVTTYNYDANGNITSIQPPSSSVNPTMITYLNGQVVSVSNGVGTWYYSYSLSGTTETTTVVDPLGHSRVAVGDTTTGLLASDTDGLGRTTSYAHDSYGRLTGVVLPFGDQFSYTYDLNGGVTRGNIVAVTHTPKPGSTLAPLTTTAGYDTNCVYPAKCNKPNWTNDALGNASSPPDASHETTYTYDTTFGVLLSVTRPAPTSGAVAPQTTLTYNQLHSWFQQDDSGSITEAFPAIDVLTGVSTCQTLSTCSGTSDEVKSTLVYGAQTGVANNLYLTSTSSGAGDGSLTATTSYGYDTTGDLTSTVGPLGSNQKTVYIYDTARQLEGIIGPNPGSAESLPYPAVSYTYDNDGQPTQIQQGTIPVQIPAEWSEFTPSLQQTITYDATGRQATTSLLPSGGSNQTLTQYGYDSAGNLICTATRMAPTATPPASACTLVTSATYGPDAITQNAYDAANELISVTTGFGTPSASVYTTLTYGPNGDVASVADANNNLTTYFRNNLNRVYKIEYPMPTLGSGASNPSDYESVDYDPNGNVTSSYRRNGQSLGFTYDALNRLTHKHYPTSSFNLDVYLSYDLLNRPVNINYNSLTGVGVTIGYDALGRKTLVTNNLTTPALTMSYQYDLAGNRKQMTWPDALSVNYTYDYLSRVTQIADSASNVLATYTYDGLGRRTQVQRAGGTGSPTTTGFDSIGRLHSLIQGFAGTSADLTDTFGYNPASQAITDTASNTAYIYHPSALSHPSMADGLNRYSTVGSTTYAYDSASNLISSTLGSTTTTYTYDSDNRLATASGPTAVTLLYDPLGRLLGSATSSATTTFLYDGDFLAGEYNSAGTLTDRYVPGPGADEPVAHYVGSGTTTIEWPRADARGSIIGWSDSSNNSGAIYGYGPYGEIPTTTWGTSRYLYTGQIAIPEARLYYYKARVYDPNLGRFLQTDPIGYAGGVNLYAYAGNDPINFTDPSGQFFGSSTYNLGGSCDLTINYSESVGTDDSGETVVTGYNISSLSGSCAGSDGVRNGNIGEGVNGGGNRDGTTVSEVTVQGHRIPLRQPVSCSSSSIVLPQGTRVALPNGYYFASATFGLFAGLGGQISYNTGFHVQGRAVVGNFHGVGVLAGVGVAAPTGVGFNFSTSNPTTSDLSMSLQGAAGIISNSYSFTPNSGYSGQTVGLGYPKGEGVVFGATDSGFNCNSGS